MAIYNIFDYAEKATAPSEGVPEKISPEEAKVGIQEAESLKDRVFSSLGARFFFLLLLIADVGWGVYVLARLVLTLMLCMMSFGKAALFNKWLGKLYLSLKRFLVAALSLFVALISPALGIMFACTYFLMYDKAGIEEIVPASLREQFKGFFSP